MARPHRAQLTAVAGKTAGSGRLSAVCIFRCLQRDRHAVLHELALPVIISNCARQDLDLA